MQVNGSAEVTPSAQGQLLNPHSRGHEKLLAQTNQQQKGPLPKIVALFTENLLCRSMMMKEFHVGSHDKGV